MAGFPNLSPPLPKLGAKAAAAVVGNATQESGVKSVAPSSEGSDGTLQWLGPRLSAMQQWCVANFGAWQSLEAQAAFFEHECSTSYQSVWAYLTTGADTRSVATLTYDLCDFYERPNAALAMLDNRLAAANATYALIAPDTPVIPVPTPAPAPPPAPIPTPTPTPLPQLDAQTIMQLIQALIQLIILIK